MQAASWEWPQLPSEPITPVLRSPRGHVEPHFLARMVDRMPRAATPMVDSYLAMLDAALLDRHICATEGDALVELAYELGLHSSEGIQAHLDYLHALTQAAWQDGVVTEAERCDLHAVAGLLGLSGELVEDTLTNEAHGFTSDPQQPALRPAIDGLALEPGDKIVLTGEMTCPRRDWVERATAAGLQITTSVSRKTRVLVAADPDSLSGKAKNARRLGVPVIGETAFARAIETMTTK